MSTTFAPVSARAVSMAPATPASAAISAPVGAPAATAPRFDMYASIHKALRSFMMDTLFRVGRMDVHDADDMGPALAQVTDLLAFCASHLKHENDFVHSAIEARQPAGALRTAGDHIEHLESIDALRAETLALLAARPGEQPMLALRLYRHLALFVAENFQHMHIEETVNNASLRAHYSDADLMRIHDELVASIPPQEQLVVARWMVPALSPFERAMVLGGMKQSAPPEAFLGVLGHVRPHLDVRGWDKLARAVGVASDLGRMPVA